MKKKRTLDRVRAVSFLDLGPQTKRVERQYLRAVRSFLSRGSFILTPEVRKFEEAWADFVGTRFSIGVSSGADALYLALRAAGVGEGHEVITQGNAYNASVTAILRTGATVRFADIDETLQMDPSALEELITPRTKAVLPVHLYGGMADMEEIVKIAERNRVLVIEDAAQAHGARFTGKSAGSFGHVAAWSFYPTKNLGAVGDAGAVTTDDPDLAESVRRTRNLGQVAKDNHQVLGFNMRLDPIQAIMLSLKLRKLPAWVRERRALADRYDVLIERLRVPVRVPPRNPKVAHAFHLYVALLPVGAPRALIQERLLECGVGTGVHYPTPVYRQPFWRGGFDPCPRADDAAERILSLPLYPGLSRRDQEHVVASLKAVL